MGLFLVTLGGFLFWLDYCVVVFCVGCCACFWLRLWRFVFWCSCVFSDLAVDCWLVYMINVLVFCLFGAWLCGFVF